MTGGVYKVEGETLVSGGTVDFSAASVASFGSLLELGGGKLELGGNNATVAAYDSYGNDIFDGYVDGYGGDLDGTGTVTVSGAASLNGDIETGDGTTMLNGATQLTGDDWLDGGRLMENAGTFTIDDLVGGTITLGSDPDGGTVGGATFENAAGGTLVSNGGGAQRSRAIRAPRHSTTSEPGRSDRGPPLRSPRQASSMMARWLWRISLLSASATPQR